MALNSASAHCQDPVALACGRPRIFRVDESLWKRLCDEELPDLLPRMTGPVSQPSKPGSALTALLSRMDNLRDLCVLVSHKVERPQDLLTAVVSASRHWPLLERLELTWNNNVQPDRDRLRQLGASCGQLNSVTLMGGFSDDDVEAVVTELPALRTLCVSSYDLKGSFLSQLPTDLHNLSLKSQSFHRWPLSYLVRCHELRSLELQSFAALMPPKQVLVGCVHLERLSLGDLGEAFVACLPPYGLPTRRHLEIGVCLLNDADFGRLVERLPGLESVSLGWCPLTPQGLAPLGRLSALNVLLLCNPECVSDWLLTQLSAAPLVELQLSALALLDEPTCTRLHISKTLSVDGLLRLIRNSQSLRLLILSARRGSGFAVEERIRCGAGVQERDVEQAIRLFVNHMARCLSDNSERTPNQ